MAGERKAYTIVHRRGGGESQTMQTGLCESEARRWLEQKAAEAGAAMTRDLTVTAGSETWSAVEAE